MRTRNQLTTQENKDQDRIKVAENGAHAGAADPNNEREEATRGAFAAFVTLCPYSQLCANTYKRAIHASISFRLLNVRIDALAGSRVVLNR